MLERARRKCGELPLQNLCFAREKMRRRGMQNEISAVVADLLRNTADAVRVKRTLRQNECEFGVEFAKNDLVIYFVRSNVAMAVNHMGEVVEIQEIQNTPENNSYWNNHVLSNSRKIGDTEYSLKNNFGIFNVFASSYSQLIVREANGEERILYDVNSAQLFNMLFMFICVLLTVCLAVAVLVRQFVKLKHVM